MDSRPCTEETRRLFSALLQLETQEECSRFFEDLCTIKEMEDLTQRWTVARLLHAGVRYADIASKTGASTATIARVNRCLHHGADGYRHALEREDGQ